MKKVLIDFLALFLFLFSGIWLVYAGLGWGENASLKKLESVSNNEYVEVLRVEEKNDGSVSGLNLTISYRILKEFQEKNAGFYQIMITFYNAIDQPFDGKSKWINKRLSVGNIGQMQFVPPMYTRSYKVWLPLNNVQVPAGTIIHTVD